MQGQAQLMSSSRMDWRTPPDILDRVRIAFGGSIHYDPCASDDDANHFAAINFTAAQDGLSLRWGQRTFFNPPYGRGIGAWTSKAEAEYMRGASCIGIVPARTDTRWFRDCWNATAICFWSGRITFIGAPAGAPFPTAFPFWGQDVGRFDRAFRDAGKVVIL